MNERVDYTCRPRDFQRLGQVEARRLMSLMNDYFGNCATFYASSNDDGTYVAFTPLHPSDNAPFSEHTIGVMLDFGRGILAALRSRHRFERQEALWAILHRVTEKGGEP
jgi:hypothetical protein